MSGECCSESTPGKNWNNGAVSLSGLRDCVKPHWPCANSFGICVFMHELFSIFNLCGGAFAHTLSIPMSKIINTYTVGRSLPAISTICV